MWICPVCGMQNTEESRYCTECGSVAPEATTSYAYAEPPTVYEPQPAVSGPIRVPLAQAPEKPRSLGWMWAVITALSVLCIGLVLYLVIHTGQSAAPTEQEALPPLDETEAEVETEPEAEVETEPETEAEPDDSLFAPASPSATAAPSEQPVIFQRAPRGLWELTPVQTSAEGGIRFYSEARDNQGSYYDNAFGGCIADTDNWADYALNGGYTHLSGTVYLNYDFRSETAHRVKLSVYGDGVLLYASPIITTGLPPQQFELDVSGVQTLRIVIYGNDYLRLSDCTLTPAD